MGHIITEKILQKYSEYLDMEEKSKATIKKYICDIKKLMAYAGGQEITKKLMLEYKEHLRINKKYKLSSINSFLIAANRLFEYLEWYGLHVKTYRIQKEAFATGKMDLSMQEYKKLVAAARHKGKKRLAMIIQTLCSMGLRISELPYITVEGVKKGEIDIYGKSKQRKALVPKKLQELLSAYIKENNIKNGTVFITSKGNAVDRSNIWREMKALKDETGITEEKIFPHNLRHLFAKKIL
ncbi:MAG: tyrosine-type recombinase/integrase [Lachnospiraceae bacterium]|nr:tyrosine-type recombinase/integrase [Lachnospiraceae bacterium]